ncbi:MAG: response regulator [Acidobacteriota bacterium]|nr:response regulator [Acidobacteriota bacterium]
MAVAHCRSEVARVLLADADPASRLALKSILSAAGYAVSGAATSAEAIGKLDKSEYQLVLADLRTESDEAGPSVLAYARQKEFRPATALIASDMSETVVATKEEHRIHVSNEDVYRLIDRVAALISHRADRRAARAAGKSHAPISFGLVSRN